MEISNVKIALIGLGYVGLPLAVEFSKKFEVIAFDINEDRIEELEKGVDSTKELSQHEMNAAKDIVFTSDESRLSSANVYIITVPTPIDKFNQPDLEPLVSASKMIGRVIAPGDIVIYESTVYPGATEDDCIPVIEKVSGLKYNVDFFAGYSPERINPGDKEHRVTNILKVTSGSTPEVADFVDLIYLQVIKAGTYKASSIRVAEAAKVIENTQRDVNIALVNELSLIFDKMNLNTRDVLEAAGTKWNFLPFKPGLVGGHCIGVDPYYLLHKARNSGYIPDLISAARKINDGMGNFVADRLVNEMLSRGIEVVQSRVLILGLTFKENCPDIRNTKVIDIYNKLTKFNVNVDIFDPWCNSSIASIEHKVRMIDSLDNACYSAVIIAVNHEEFEQYDSKFIRAMLGNENGIIYDLKGVLDKNSVDLTL